ncbi:MAG: hypothetical protein KKE29_19980 [Proteobacteria bacterium]|nr:hypothetical protein [Pseudomonadota bacterium]MBV1715969.1 hypothetical protein [Desulfarculus sp.]
MAPKKESAADVVADLEAQGKGTRVSSNEERPPVKAPGRANVANLGQVEFVQRDPVVIEDPQGAPAGTTIIHR